MTKKTKTNSPRATRAATPTSNINKCSSNRSSSECGSCFNMSELREIQKSLKTNHNIEVKGKSYKTLYNSIVSNLACKKDRCVIKKLNMDRKLKNKLEDVLIPEAPLSWVKDPTSWLSNIDIEKKVKEFTRKKRYNFLGVFPMDFEHLYEGNCVSREVCAYSPLEDRSKGISKFIMVLNTDYHDSSGSHWVFLIGYTRPTDPKYGIYYYDSNGKPPTRDVDNFVTRISEMLYEKDNTIIPYTYNDISHQRSNTECGMFCISMIDIMINTPRSFSMACEKMDGDRRMIENRSIYFEIPM
ncbi:putative cysteine protease [Tetraselmis virus 1]|uniref:Putative cysteine protease n=1 Tax=Tetraselmis virus 1 TaxID=2060617 RepID=A0A2P0VNR2_9VIRU|nr:putative cysteine protease [Tetraselmis virus 1]AUF82543.1 putative cysteine protease [Tetraselmis virus 1]